MHFRDLNEAQILALAITAEEEDARIYRDFAESLRADFPATAELFTKMAGEEDGHRHRLIELYRQRFGEHIPLIRRQDVKGFVVRRPSWFTRTLRPEHARARSGLDGNRSAPLLRSRRAADEAMPAFANSSMISPRKSSGTKPPPRKSRMRRPHPVH